MAERNISKMMEQLVGPSHTYGGGSLTINKDAPGFYLNDVISIVIFSHVYHHTISEHKGNFLYTILNGETVDLIGMIYKTIIFQYVSLSLSSLHYPSLITRWGYSLLPSFFFA